MNLKRSHINLIIKIPTIDFGQYWSNFVSNLFLPGELTLSEKIKLWSGFSTITYFQVQEDGERVHITLKSNGPPREAPEEAWEDAVRLEGTHDKHANETGIIQSNVYTGICPTHFLTL